MPDLRAIEQRYHDILTDTRVWRNHSALEALAIVQRARDEREAAITEAWTQHIWSSNACE